MLEISLENNILTLMTPNGTLAPLAQGQNFKVLQVVFMNEEIQYKSNGVSENSLASIFALINL